MPRRKAYKKRYKKKYKKKYKQSSMGLVNSLGMAKYSPMARTLKGTLKYQDRFRLSGGAAGVPRLLIYSANGLYDPQTAVGGHQPRGFDQIMAMYDHFCVIAASCEVTFHNTDTTQAQICAISILADAGIASKTNDYMEDTITNYNVVGRTDAGDATKTIKVNVTPSKFLGVSKPLSEADLHGSVSANPVEQVYFHIWCAALDETVIPSPMQITIQLCYTVIFTEPKNPTVS